MANKAPTGLGRKAAALWTRTTTAYELRADELRVLEDACREADLIDLMVGELAESGTMITGSMGQQRIHPMISEIRQHRAVLATLLRALRLPDEGPVVNQQRAAGQSSWAAKRGA